MNCNYLWEADGLSGFRTWAAPEKGSGADLYWFSCFSFYVLNSHHCCALKWSKWSEHETATVRLPRTKDRNIEDKKHTWFVWTNLTSCILHVTSVKARPEEISSRSVWTGGMSKKLLQWNSLSLVYLKMWWMNTIITQTVNSPLYPQLGLYRCVGIRAGLKGCAAGSVQRASCRHHCNLPTCLFGR